MNDLHDWEQVDWTDGTTTWRCLRCGDYTLGAERPKDAQKVVITYESPQLTCSEYIVYKVLEE